MLERLLSGLAFVAALGSGLIAGLFFVFSVVIMSALGRLPPPGGIAAMQSINKVIINPWFFTAFFGTAAACLILGIAAIFRWSEPGAILLLSACLFYLSGSIAVTMVWNVPLNDALAAVDPHSAEGATVWADYLARWTAWNHVRTFASLAAAALFTAAMSVSE